MLDTIASTAPVQANRVLAVFRKACNWAVEREYLSAPPTYGVLPCRALSHRRSVACLGAPVPPPSCMPLRLNG